MRTKHESEGFASDRRSRLDEIVEEVWTDSVSVNFIENGKVIAERAFRHGVEQFARFGYVAEGRRHIVQPEPVGEKRLFHRPSCMWNTSPLFICDCGDYDRRKGQRRKGMEWKWLASRDLMCAVFSADGTIWPDRRSGKDRRKA